MSAEEEAARVAELQRQAAADYAAAQDRAAEARDALAFARMHGNEAASS
ncbi:hypothetical protein ACFCV8_00890 [Streptomyces sp. NPDC056347]